jgi:hypothetical protein
MRTRLRLENTNTVFRCQWIKYLNSVNVDNYGLIPVDLKNLGHKDDPWVLADRVFYTPARPTYFLV